MYNELVMGYKMVPLLLNIAVTEVIAYSLVHISRLLYTI